MDAIWNTLNSMMEDPIVKFLAGLSLMILFFWYFATELQKRKRNIGTALLIIITGLCVIAATPPSEKLTGAVDIVGGSSFTLTIQAKEDANGNPMPITNEQINQAIEVIRKRLDPGGNQDLLIAQQGTNGLLVQMPGIEPEKSEEIREKLEKVAKLELKKVHPRSGEPGDDGRSLAARVLSNDEIVPGYEAYEHVYKDDEGNDIQSAILLTRRSALGGSDIANAFPSGSRSDAVSVTLNGEGGNKMVALTQNMNLGVDRIAIVLDGEVVSAPTVQAKLYKQFEISGLDEPGEVKTLANQLMNPLENPLIVEEMRLISPTLGAAVVTQGLFAGAFALGLTYLFMLVYYRFSGIVAVIALTINGVILFGAMAMFNFAFSLPGIAGMVLIIGMAVDANVLIYERMREEIASGKSIRNAIQAAYDKAFSAIFDSNITSLITASILFILGSGAIKGFAITLIIGICASMFTAILGTRVLFHWGSDMKLIKKLSFMNVISSTSINFLSKRKIYAVIALILIAASFAGFGTKREKALGIDFVGGTRLIFQLGDVKDIPLDKIKASLAELDLEKQAYPQEERNAASGLMLSVRCATADAGDIAEQLKASFPEELGSITPSTEEVSSVIGGAFMQKSIIALACGMIAIMLYMTARFEFSFALGGFVAMLHDIIISVGIIVLLGRELSLIHVGAILTIAGYSINDTIIVFDRIRELVLIRTGSIEKVMNEAINATLSRTVITSGTTLITVVILTIFGGAALRDFGLIILIGIVVGTFSSIFIASPIVLWWSNSKGRSIRDEVMEAEAKAEEIATAP